MAMEMPLINSVGELEREINSIADPSVIPPVFAVSGFQSLIIGAFGFCKWGALIIAVVASFATVMKRIRVFIVRYRKLDRSSASPPLDYDYDSESEVSSASESDSEEDADEDESEKDEKEESDARPVSSFSTNWRRVDEDSLVRGSSGYYLDKIGGQSSAFELRRRRSGGVRDLLSWADLGAGGGSSSVVKLWDNFGLSLQFPGAVLDSVERNVVVPFLGEGRVSPTPSVVLTSSKRGSGGLGFCAWDSRAGSRAPALLAEWKRPRRLLERIVGVRSGAAGKVYVRDGVSGAVAVGDMRKADAPLFDVDASGVETWWDADAVIVPDNFAGESLSGNRQE